MGKGKYQTVDKRIPGLAVVPTGEIIKIGKHQYRVLKLMYDLKGEYIPLAPPIPTQG